MLLTLQNIHKQFGEVKVLKGIDLQLSAGRVLGLIGENGAGKSTLMNLIGGLLTPTEGTLLLDGAAYAPRSPQDAQASGIAFIHQELNLFPNLTVSENLLLQNFPTRRVLGVSLLDRSEARAKAERYLAEVGLDVAPDTPVEQLSPAQRQMVEIAKALSSQPRLIIFDEPTTSLTRHEVGKLFALIEKLKERGIAMIYISHNLEDVIELSDDIVVLRDGALVANRQRNQGYDLPDLVNKMVGRDLNQFFPERTHLVGETRLLEVRGLAAGKRVRKVDFVVREQEILGFYGLVGAGRSELARLLYGLDEAEAGEISWRGQVVEVLSPEKWIERGVGFLTEDRREEGLLLGQSILENVRLAALREFTGPPFGRLRYREAHAVAAAGAEATHLKYQSLSEQPVSTLSGGNQQKVVLAKWLLTKPDLLILDEPTKGIDIGAKHEIYRLINELVASGGSVLLISSEIEELMGTCDRILVMSEGLLEAEFNRDQFNRAAILAAALHG